jgi:CBS domain-containing protein
MSSLIFIPGCASDMCIMACFLRSASPIGVMRVQPHSHDIILAMENILVSGVISVCPILREAETCLMFPVCRLGAMEALVDSVMRPKPEAVDPDITVTAAAGLVAKRSEQCLVVVENGLVVGIATSTDMIEKVIAVGANPKEVLLRDVMSTPVITVKVKATITEAAQIMSDYGVPKLPVVGESGELVGLVTSLELARWLAKKNDFQDPALNALARLKEEGGGPYR